MTAREQPWSDGATVGRVVVVTRNPIAEAIEVIASTAGRGVVVVAEDEGGAAVAAVQALGLTDTDAVVLCDHDASDAPRLLRELLGSRASYVAMMASRGRSESLLAELRSEGYDDSQLARLHVPAGLDTGGKAPGEIALSVVAEIVACSYGKQGGPMRSRDA